MLDRQKLETVLIRRFSGAAKEQIAAAANAIMGLEEEWEEVDTQEHEEFGYHFSVQCNDICSLARQAAQGAEFRLLRRRMS
jgi:Asp-tRNA(Asn)/Glu-tRNA(Gln) amidotransferase C subunit